MIDAQQRLIEEIKDLEEKHRKLNVFLKSEKVIMLNDEELELMTLQSSQQLSLLHTLKHRLSIWRNI